MKAACPSDIKGNIMSFHNHEHNHSHAHSTNTRILRVSLAVIAGFMLVEAAARWITRILTL